MDSRNSSTKIVFYQNRQSEKKNYATSTTTIAVALHGRVEIERETQRCAAAITIAAVPSMLKALTTFFRTHNRHRTTQK